MVVEIKQPKINKYKGHLSMCPQMSGRMDHPVTHARTSMDSHACADIRRKSRMRRQLVAI